jgi:hypothetical protein
MLCDKNESFLDLEKVILCGFGIGLSWGTASLSLKKTTFYKPNIYYE